MKKPKKRAPAAMGPWRAGAGFCEPRDPGGNNGIRRLFGMKGR